MGKWTANGNKERFYCSDIPQSLHVEDLAKDLLQKEWQKQATFDFDIIND